MREKSTPPGIGRGVLFLNPVWYREAGHHICTIVTNISEEVRTMKLVKHGHEITDRNAGKTKSSLPEGEYRLRIDGVMEDYKYEGGRLVVVHLLG